MARKAAWPPVPYRHSTGQAVVKVAGKPHYLGPHGSKEAEDNLAALVRRVEAERRGQGQVATALPPAAAPPVTVAAVMARWEAEVLPLHTPKERSLHLRAGAVLLAVHGGTPAADFGRDELAEVRDAMASGSWLGRKAAKGTTPAIFGPHPGPWCRRTCNSQCGRIKTAWRWLEQKKLVPKGAWAGLSSLPGLRRGAKHGAKEPPARPDVGHEDILRVALAIKRSPARRLLLLQLWTGCRSGEARAMLRGEVERRGSGPWAWRPAKHKLAHKGILRCILLGPKARAVMVQQERLFPGGWLHAFPKVFRGVAHDAPLSAEAYSRTCLLAARRIGLERFRPYWARHAA